MLQLLPTLFCVALSLSLALTWAVRAIALRFRLVRTENSRHHDHALSVPRLGGVAIFTAFGLSLLFSDGLLKFFGLHDFNIGITHSALAAMIVAGGLVFAVGVVDDLYDCRPVTKLAIEMVAASLIFAAGVRIGSFPYLGQHYGTALSYLITVAFILFVTNAFNLIDGMDGLAAGSALFSTIAVGAVAVLNHRNPILLVTTGLAGVLIGFLRFNFNPATIFLGDSGSLFVGFILSAAAVSGAQKLPTFVAVVLPVMVFAIPVLDTVLSIFRRALRSKPIFVADRDHIHHRLLLRGLTQRQAVLILYAVSCISALLTLLLLYSARTTAAVLIVFCGVIAIVVVKLDYEDLRELRAAITRSLVQRRAISSNIEFRKLLHRIEPLDDFQLALREINDHLTPCSEMQFIRGAQELEIPPHTLARWSLAIPIVDEYADRTATVLLASYAERLPIDMRLLVESGEILARMAEGRKKAPRAMAAAAARVNEKSLQLGIRDKG